MGEHVRIEKAVPNDDCEYKIQEACSLTGAGCYNWYKKRATRFSANTVVITQANEEMSTFYRGVAYKDIGEERAKVTTNLTADLTGLAEYYSCPKR